MKLTCIELVGTRVWSERLWTPICWYQKCESHTAGIEANAMPQYEGVHILVEYRLQFYWVIAVVFYQDMDQ